MNSMLTKKFNENEMKAVLGEMLAEGEYIEAAVYCAFKDTGFFASNVAYPGYAAVTDKNRFICCNYGIINSEAGVKDFDELTKIKISKSLFGQKSVLLKFGKDEYYFHIAPKVAGSGFPEQSENFEKLVEYLENVKQRNDM